MLDVLLCVVLFLGFVLALVIRSVQHDRRKTEEWWQERERQRKQHEVRL